MCVDQAREVRDTAITTVKSAFSSRTGARSFCQALDFSRARERFPNTEQDVFGNMSYRERNREIRLPSENVRLDFFSTLKETVV